MAAQVSVTSQVQVVFTVTDPDRPDGVSFTDALYYPVGQVPSNAAVRTAALARYQAWRATLDSHPPRPPRAERIRLVVICPKEEAEPALDYDWDTDGLASGRYLIQWLVYDHRPKPVWEFMDFRLQRNRV